MPFLQQLRLCHPPLESAARMGPLAGSTRLHFCYFPFLLVLYRFVTAQPRAQLALSLGGRFLVGTKYLLPSGIFSTRQDSRCTGGAINFSHFSIHHIRIFWNSLSQGTRVSQAEDDAVAHRARCTCMSESCRQSCVWCVAYLVRGVYSVRTYDRPLTDLREA